MALRVAVIGAGPSGLATLRLLTAEPDKFQATCFEQWEDVGTSWIYTEKTGKDEYGLPIFSSMYKHLRANLPKEVTGFPGFSVDKSLPSYLKREDLWKYLNDYAKRYNLKDHVRFLTTVKCVKPIFSPNGKTKWEVTTQATRQPDLPKEVSEFDAVIVCNGHLSVPMVPDIKGMSNFKGNIIHSHDYRIPDVYRSKRVVILGAYFSGLDIAFEIATCATKVVLSHNLNPWTFPFPSNVTQVKGIASITANAVQFLDGSEEEVDSIILCTGYQRTLEFLSPECGIEIQDGRVTPLFKHMINTTHPTLSFVGINDYVTFLFFYYQALVVVKHLGGSIQLPSKEDMDKDTARDYEERRKLGMDRPHSCNNLGIEYWKQLAELGDLGPIPEAEADLMELVQFQFATDCNEFRNSNYELIDGKYQVVTRMSPTL